jgi:hypothetical protein|tara:strand:- start:948 stop:1706 length:759 start_codon:yes stop_codon:yes gene_type:complete
MVLTAEQVKANYDVLLGGIDKYITGDRKGQFTDFYTKLDDRIALLPASHKKAYHNCFPGGYVDHVVRVITAAFKLHSLWQEMGTKDTYTEEELFVSALNHDLGKIGSIDETSVHPSTDEWRKKNLGEMYTFNTKIEYMTVPDRSLFLLQQAGIQLTTNEWITIKTHDGLYDDANKAYLKSFMPETKPRTSLPFIIHQADLMASRIEFEREWLDTFSGPAKKVEKTTKQDRVNANLGKIGSTDNNLMDLVKNL